VPLPFISYGSTNLTVLLASMGLLLNVAAGGRAQLKVVTGSRRDGADDRDRRRRDGGARVPALAVADALQADGAHVVFVGGERAERTLVPAAGYELRTIAVEGLSRSNPLKAARAAVKAVGAVGAASRILREVRPTPSWAAAGTSPGRSGWPRRCGASRSS